MWHILASAMGGAIGCVSRYFLAETIYEAWGDVFPYGILVANVIGCLLMGCLATIMVHKMELSIVWRGAVLVGFLGGLTTFSSFSLDTVRLIEEGFVAKAAIYVLASVVLCVSATLLGVFVAEKVS